MTKTTTTIQSALGWNSSKIERRIKLDEKCFFSFRVWRGNGKNGKGGLVRYGGLDIFLYFFSFFFLIDVNEEDDSFVRRRGGGRGGRGRWREDLFDVKISREWKIWTWSWKADEEAQRAGEEEEGEEDEEEEEEAEEGEEEKQEDEVVVVEEWGGGYTNWWCVLWSNSRSNTALRESERER